MTAGPILFARYAYPPNALGYCGPADSGALLEYAAGPVSDAGLAALARQFSGAWPYLTLIAAANRYADPLAEAVVEAYWLGGPLLERIPARLLAAHVVDRFADRIGGSPADLAELALSGGRAHHNFHVFAVYPWVGLLRAGHVEEPMRVLDSCRIRWGRVLSVHSGLAEVESQPLCWTGRELTLGPARIASVRSAVPVCVGDVVSLHWDWVCDRLTDRQLRALRGYTLHHLELVNHRVEHSGPALALGTG